MNWDVLQYGEIQIYKFWTNDGIAARIAQQIRAISAAGRRRGCYSRETSALGGKRSRCGRESIATYINVRRGCSTDVVVVNRIASGNAVRNAELVSAAIPQSRWVSIINHSGGAPSIDLYDTSELPPSQRRLYKDAPRFRSSTSPKNVT